jgi:hypothetical protein
MRCMLLVIQIILSILIMIENKKVSKRIVELEIRVEQLLNK